MIESHIFICTILCIVCIGWNIGLLIQCDNIPALKWSTTEVIYIPILYIYLLLWMLFTCIRDRNYKQFISFVRIPNKSIIILSLITKAATANNRIMINGVVIITPRNIKEGIQLAKAFFYKDPYIRKAECNSETRSSSIADKI